MLNKEIQAFIHINVNLPDGSLAGDLAEGTHILKDTCRPDLTEISCYSRSIKFQQVTLSASFHPYFFSSKFYSIGNKKGDSSNNSPF